MEQSMLGMIAFVWPLAISAILTVCAWRAMRAHEKLAATVELLSWKQASEIDDLKAAYAKKAPDPKR